MMGLSAGTQVEQVRLFLQDSANDWALLGDVYSEKFTVPAGFRVYSGCTNIKLQEREAYIAAPVTLVEGAQYQWYLDGEAIEGATGETYAVYGKTGTYSVKITAPDGAEKTVDTLRVTEIRSSDLLYGDANGDGSINIRDVVLIRKYLADYDYDTESSSVDIAPGADANGDGEVSIRDVVLLRKYLADYDYETGESGIVLGP